MHEIHEQSHSGPAPFLPIGQTLEHLPEDPADWSRVLTLRMPLAGGAISTTFEILDPAGQAYPFAYCARTGPRGVRGFGSFAGFFLPGDVADAAHALTWSALVAAWPAWRANQLTPRRPAPAISR